MKRILVLLISFISLSIFPCTPPTPHGIINIGAFYDYRGVWDANNVGMSMRIGFEEPYRYATIYAVGQYMFDNMDWSCGAEISFNPLGVKYGYDTPVNFTLFGGGGYKSYIENHWYARVGLELTGRMGTIVTPYINCSCDFNNKIADISPNINAGIRIWLGKDF